MRLLLRRTLVLVKRNWTFIKVKMEANTLY